jgi:hypothetical protein
MPILDRQRVAVTLSRSAAAQSLLAEATDQALTHISTAPVGDEVELSLYGGESFKIVSVPPSQSPIGQSLKHGDSATWSFDVTPLVGGDQQLEILLAVVDPAGRQEVHPPFSKIVKVHVSWTARFKLIVAGYGGWFVNLVLVPLFVGTLSAILALAYVNRRERLRTAAAAKRVPPADPATPPAGEPPLASAEDEDG